MRWMPGEWDDDDEAVAETETAIPQLTVGWTEPEVIGVLLGPDGEVWVEVIEDRRCGFQIPDGNT